MVKKSSSRSKITLMLMRAKIRTLFDMGKTYISSWNGDKSWLYDRELMLEAICQQYANNENFTVGYCLWLRDQLWEFIKNVQNEREIEILNDSGHGFTIFGIEPARDDV